jgi:hypothetical protein
LARRCPYVMAPRRSADRRGGRGALHVPNRNERQIALILLEKARIASDAARAQLEQISQGQPVADDALERLRSLEEMYTRMRNLEEMYTKERLPRRLHSIE